jgi:hypothetical protein
VTDRLGILLDRWPYAIIGGLLVAILLTERVDNFKLVFQIG